MAKTKGTQVKRVKTKQTAKKPAKAKAVKIQSARKGPKPKPAKTKAPKPLKALKAPKPLKAPKAPKPLKALKALKALEAPKNPKPVKAKPPAKRGPKAKPVETKQPAKKEPKAKTGVGKNNTPQRRKAKTVKSEVPSSKKRKANPVRNEPLNKKTKYEADIPWQHLTIVQERPAYSSIAVPRSFVPPVTVVPIAVPVPDARNVPGVSSSGINNRVDAAPDSSTRPTAVSSAPAPAPYVNNSAGDLAQDENYQFLMKNYSALTTRVKNVIGIVDDLEFTNEKMEIVQVQSTDHDKMRKVLSFTQSKAAAELLMKALWKHACDVMEDLTQPAA